MLSLISIINGPRWPLKRRQPTRRAILSCLTHQPSAWPSVLYCDGCPTSWQIWWPLQGRKRQLMLIYNHCIKTCSLGYVWNNTSMSTYTSNILLLLNLKSYILPLFDSCDNVWSVCTKEESHQLETPLNFACRTVLYKRRDHSPSFAHKELDISTLTAKWNVHLTQTVYKCISLYRITYLS